ncbi:MAG: hypothetical protein ACR2LK_04500 [Solirubrobacteraceae bacterium]
MQPRQIYASTLTRRERRARLRPRGRGPLNRLLVTAASLCAALSVLAIFVPGVA